MTIEPNTDWSIIRTRFYKGYEFRLTCMTCPEQYDIYVEGQNPIGYLRHRHGRTTLNAFDPSGPLIWVMDWVEQATGPDGYLPDAGREKVFESARMALAHFHFRGSTGGVLHMIIEPDPE